LTVQRTT